MGTGRFGETHGGPPTKVGGGVGHHIGDNFLISTILTNARTENFPLILYRSFTANITARKLTHPQIHPACY